MDFCLWSYIIFSTIPRVSPSRSDSCSGGQRRGDDEARRGRDCAGSQHLKSYLGVLRADLLGVDLRVRGDDLVPPLHLIDLRLKSTFSSSCFDLKSFKGLFLPTFSRWTVTTLPSSISQELSSTLTSLKSWPSMMGGWPFRPTLSERRWMSTTTSRPLMRKLTLKGTASCRGSTMSEKNLKSVSRL